MKKVKNIKGDPKKNSIKITFNDNNHALKVFGVEENHLKIMATKLGVDFKTRGNEVFIDGDAEDTERAERCLQFLREKSHDGNEITESDVNDALKVLMKDNTVKLNSVLKKQVIISVKKKISPRTIGQKHYVDAIEKNDIVFGIGPAGTGKTYLAMAVAMSKVLKGEIERIILTRPAVEAGEKLGFLPGDMAEKVNPYLRPLLDALHEMIDYERAERMIASGQIEIAPIAFMRGRTLNDSYVILDEAQNCTREQMKMFLTRLGENSRAVITGDVTQIDLPLHTKSGLIQAIRILKGISNICIHKFDETDVVRHPLVAHIIRAYDNAQKVP